MTMRRELSPDIEFGSHLAFFRNMKNGLIKKGSAILLVKNLIKMQGISDAEMLSLNVSNFETLNSKDQQMFLQHFQALLKYLEKYSDAILGGENKEFRVHLFTNIFTNILNYQQIIEAALTPVLAKMRQEKEEAEQKAIEARSARQAAEAENAELRRQLAAVTTGASEVVSTNSKKRALDAGVAQTSVSNTSLPSKSGLYSASEPLKKARTLSSSSNIQEGKDGNDDKQNTFK